MALASLSPTISCLTRIPLDFAAQADRDVAQSGNADRAVLAFDVGDHRQVVLEALEEIAHVIAEFGQVAFEQGFHVVHDFFFAAGSASCSSIGLP